MPLFRPFCLQSEPFGAIAPLTFFSIHPIFAQNICSSDCVRLGASVLNRPSDADVGPDGTFFSLWMLLYGFFELSFIP